MPHPEGLTLADANKPVHGFHCEEHWQHALGKSRCLFLNRVLPMPLPPTHLPRLQVLTGSESPGEALGGLVTPLAFVSEVLGFNIGATSEAAGGVA